MDCWRAVDLRIDRRASGQELIDDVQALVHRCGPQTVKIQPDRLAVLREALGSARRGGTVSILGVYGGWYPRFPLGDLFDKQITVRMGQANVRKWVDDLLPLLTDGDPLGLDDLITHRLPLAEAPAAYEMFQAKKDGAVKIVLDQSDHAGHLRPRPLDG